MKATIQTLKRVKLETFAEEHGLKIEVFERSPTWYCGTNFAQNRWYAHFAGVDVMEPHVLVGKHGNGATPYKAVRDYAKQISEQHLAVDAFKPNRRNIIAPVLY